MNFFFANVDLLGANLVLPPVLSPLPWGERVRVRVTLLFPISFLPLEGGGLKRG
jgi:hypothetical protein